MYIQHIIYTYLYIIYTYIFILSGTKTKQNKTKTEKFERNGSSGASLRYYINKVTL